MSTFAYFVDEQYIKDNSPIDDNVDSKLLATAMRTAQDIYIRDIIGSGIYDEITDQINASTLAADSENTTLVTHYIAPCLLHYVISEAALPMTFKMMNKSISTRNSDNSNPLDIDQLVKLQNYYKDRAEYYANRLREYLEENHTLYPLFHNPGNGQDVIHPKRTTFYSGFYFDNGSDCIDYEEPKN